MMDMKYSSTNWLGGKGNVCIRATTGMLFSFLTYFSKAEVRTNKFARILKTNRNQTSKTYASLFLSSVLQPILPTFYVPMFTEQVWHRCQEQSWAPCLPRNTGIDWPTSNACIRRETDGNKDLYNEQNTDEGMINSVWGLGWGSSGCNENPPHPRQNSELILSTAWVYINMLSFEVMNRILTDDG